MEVLFGLSYQNLVDVPVVKEQGMFQLSKRRAGQSSGRRTGQDLFQLSQGRAAVEELDQIFLQRKEDGCQIFLQRSMTWNEDFLAGPL